MAQGAILALSIINGLLIIFLVSFFFAWIGWRERNEKLQSTNDALVKAAEVEEATTKERIGKWARAYFDSLPYLDIVRAAATEFVQKAETSGVDHRRWQEMLASLTEDPDAFAVLQDAIESAHAAVQEQFSHHGLTIASGSEEEERIEYGMTVPSYHYRLFGGNAEPIESGEGEAPTKGALLDILGRVDASTVEVTLPSGEPLNGPLSTVMQRLSGE